MILLDIAVYISSGIPLVVSPPCNTTSVLTNVHKQLSYAFILVFISYNSETVDHVINSKHIGLHIII